MYFLLQHYFNMQNYPINEIINGCMSVFSTLLCVYE